MSVTIQSAILINVSAEENKVLKFQERFSISTFIHGTNVGIYVLEDVSHVLLEKI